MRRGKEYRLAGEINVSRAFGDFKHKPIITSNPEVKRFLKDEIKYIIVGSDGFWSQTSNEKVRNKIQ
jgi:serine/threonine protein phosphatase PrpC